MVGALPLYPAFLDPPADPSPYLPVSRLAYNEVFVDPTALPELAAAPEARRLLASDEFRRRLAVAHSAASLVDYEEVSRLRRQVLAPMAAALLGGPRPRRRRVLRLRRRRTPSCWPTPASGPPATGSAARVPALVRADEAERAGSDASAYHLYAQWAAAAATERGRHRATPLYADLPVGVHPEGFDPLLGPASFVPGVHGGAPPDLFFAGGQDWAFPPLHPERMRDDGYHYFIGVLRRAVRHAAYLRVDHVMGLQRLYWIPEGFDAQHGAYVSYRADELHAIVSLEAHRAGAVVVGRGPGHGARRSARAHGRRTGCCARGSSSSSRRPTDPLPTRPPACWPHGEPTTCPASRAYFVGRRHRRERERPDSSRGRGGDGATAASARAGAVPSVRATGGDEPMGVRAPSD